MAKKSKAAKKATRTGRVYADDARITLLVEGNPRRKGSATYKIYALYKDGMTVGQFLQKGGRLVDVAADVERGNIKVG